MTVELCPVCRGNGKVARGFYDHAGDCPIWTSDHTLEMCRACEGKGFIIIPALPFIYDNPQTTDVKELK